ncbi:MAG: hypothetical protein AABY88_07895 [Pseudomonadota bacterium]
MESTLPQKEAGRAKKRPSGISAKPSGKGFFELLRKPLGSQPSISMTGPQVLDETDINYVETFG